METNNTNKLALLIDSDNVAAKYAQFILTEASKYGELIIKRVYGDWEKTNTGWRIPAMNNSILPIQQNSYIAGKNATDFSMIIDAMDIMYKGVVDGFVLVTSDSDFTRLAIRLREAGMLVVGIGEVKTPIAFTSSCHHFSYLNQVCESQGDYDELKLRRTILEYVQENDDGKLDLGKINAYLTSCFGSIDYAALGFNRLSMFIDSFPELRRKSNFVMMKKKGTARSKLRAPDAPGEQEIVSTIIEYLKRKPECRDNIARVNEYLTKVYGKVDFSRFGSKRFVKFADKQPRLKRVRDDLYPAEDFKAANTARPEQKQERVSARPDPKPEQRQEPDRALEEHISPKPAPQPAPEQEPERMFEEHISPKPARQEKPTLRITKQVFDMEVRRYAEDNGVNGGNLGQLNNILLEKYGKNYIAELGFADFAGAVATVAGVTAEKNFVKLTQKPDEAHARTTRPQKDKKRRAPEPAPEPAPVPEQTTGQEPEQKPEQTAEQAPDEEIRLELNSIKRDVFTYITANGDSATAPALGNELTRKYGRGYLKELGFPTLKKLLSGIKGVKVKGSALSMDKDFIERTEEIEQFVYDFARGEGKRSIKALSGQLRKRFEGFDFNDYGYSKFSEFINAIDGVRANGYYVEPEI